MPFIGRKPEPPPETEAKPPPKEEPKPGQPISVNVSTPRQAAPVPVPRSPDEISLINLQQISSDFRKYHDYDRNPDSARLLARTIEVELRKLIYEFAGTVEEADEKWFEIRELEKDMGEETAEYVEALHGRLYRERASHGLEHSVALQSHPALPAEATSDSIRKKLQQYQLTPDDAFVTRIAIRIVRAIRKKELIILNIEGDPKVGPFGKGKGQLEYQILYWCFEMLQPKDADGEVLKFDARHDIMYGFDLERLDYLFDLDIESPFGVDEPLVFDKWRWNEKKPVNIQQYTERLETYRKMGRPLVVCGPFWTLNERMRSTVITHRLTIKKWDDERFLGEAILRRKCGYALDRPEDEDKWWEEEDKGAFHGLKRNQYLLMDALAKEGNRRLQDRKGPHERLASDAEWLSDLLKADEDEEPETSGLLPPKVEVSPIPLKRKATG